MANLRNAVVIGLVGFLAGAAWMEYRDAPADKVVVIDGWWAKDYAKEACRGPIDTDAELAAGVAAGVPDYGFGAVPFLQEVASSMATDPNCAGVTVVYAWGPGDGKKTLAFEQGPHKMLIVDYVPGYDRPSWGMDGAAGKGTSKEIAAEVCLVVSGNGARIAP
jgi:hypothetical protein